MFKAKKLKPLLFTFLIVLLLRPLPLPMHSNIFSFPINALYQPQFTLSNLLTHPLLEQFRSLSYHYFNYLSPKFLFTVLHPVEIVFVSLGIYYLANLNNARLNYFWFGILTMSPLISGLLLIIPLSILQAAGLVFLFSNKSTFWRLATFSLIATWIFQIIKQLDFYLIHLK